MDAYNASLYQRDILSRLESIYNQTSLMDIMDKTETKFANMFNVKNPLLTRSGSEGFLIALLAMGVKPNDEVILPVSICQSMVNMVMLLKATPVLSDVDEYLALQESNFTNYITPKTKVVVFTHSFGKACDINWLVSLQREYGFYIVEDCCQTLAVSYNGVSVGTSGNVSIFSFGNGKPLSIGIGGMICSNNPLLYEETMKRSRLYYLDDTNYEVLGLNSNLSTIDILFLSHRLDQWEEIISVKKQKANRYIEHLRDIGSIIGEQSNIFHRIIMELDLERYGLHYGPFVQKLENRLNNKSNYCFQQSQPNPPHKIKCVNDYYMSINRNDLMDCNGEKYPNWRKFSERYFFFRTGNNLTNEQIDETCNELKEMLFHQ
ncbi:aminotransferase class V-fold PLP-dependent enzyme [Paenibacillus faecalis]|uniref:aminotransferase class V-fold PLP-dependent enzyme n=1 Tax=Paenibacillus faecalis TaxID=2079532 RepID=UPI00131A55D4|nr:aminotransferase class V-fold PLP-dependent enzyme [Paenibacillus faecalis]